MIRSDDEHDDGMTSMMMDTTDDDDDVSSMPWKTDKFDAKQFHARQRMARNRASLNSLKKQQSIMMIAVMAQQDWDARTCVQLKRS